MATTSGTGTYCFDGRLAGCWVTEDLRTPGIYGHTGIATSEQYLLSVGQANHIFRLICRLSPVSTHPGSRKTAKIALAFARQHHGESHTRQHQDDPR